MATPKKRIFTLRMDPTIYDLVIAEMKRDRRSSKCSMIDVLCAEALQRRAEESDRRRAENDPALSIANR